MNAAQDTVMTVETARKVLSIVDQGLCEGLGKPIPGQMCVEAAVCYALGLPHDDDPKCVNLALRSFVITLNDSPWSNPTTRAMGMRKLAIAQLGSLGAIDSITFAQKLVEQTIRRLLPPMLRQIGLNGAANRCKREGTEEAAKAACSAACSAAYAAKADYTAAQAAARATANAANAAYLADYAARLATDAADDARYAATDAAADAAAATARAAAEASYAAAEAEARDGVLMLMCDICIDILRDMRAPGIALMDQVC